MPIVIRCMQILTPMHAQCGSKAPVARLHHALCEELAKGAKAHNADRQPLLARDRLARAVLKVKGLRRVERNHAQGWGRREGWGCEQAAACESSVAAGSAGCASRHARARRRTWPAGAGGAGCAAARLAGQRAGPAASCRCHQRRLTAAAGPLAGYCLLQAAPGGKQRRSHARHVAAIEWHVEGATVRRERVAERRCDLATETGSCGRRGPGNRRKGCQQCQLSIPGAGKAGAK